MGMTRIEVSSKLDEIVNFAGINKYIDTPLKRFSSGMKVRLGFAVAAFLEPEILIFDEVMSQIDTKGKKLIKEIIILLKEKGKTIVMVEHDLENAEIADRKLLLKNGRLKKFAGEL